MAAQLRHLLKTTRAQQVDHLMPHGQNRRVASHWRRCKGDVIAVGCTSGGTSVTIIDITEGMSVHTGRQACGTTRWLLSVSRVKADNEETLRLAAAAHSTPKSSLDRRSRYRRLSPADPSSEMYKGWPACIYDAVVRVESGDAETTGG